MQCSSTLGPWYVCLQGIVHWLDLPEPEPDTWQRVLAQAANRGHNPNGKADGCNSARPEMLPETRAMLQAFYAPWNAMLAAQLGEEYTWEYQ